MKHNMGVKAIRRAFLLRNTIGDDRLLEIASPPPKARTLADALENIHKAGGHVWEGIVDPGKFIREMREA